MLEIEKHCNIFKRQNEIGYENMKSLIRISSVLIAFIFFCCEFPDTQDELEPIPGVWAVFSPDRQVEVYITKVVDFDVDIPSQDSAFISDAELNLRWETGEIQFQEIMEITEYGDRPVYVPMDTTFRVQPGITYTLSGVTEFGNFEGIVTVPHSPNFHISPEISIFDNVRECAFAMSIDADESVYEYEIYFETIGSSREYLPDSIILMDCYQLRWIRENLPSSIGIPWCKFYYATDYCVKVQAREKNLYDYLDYYYYYDEEEDTYMSPPGGNGYTGVIGAYCESQDTVSIILGTELQ